MNDDDYVDFIFTFEDANTWCGGYRQFGHAAWQGSPTFTKDIEIYTGDANFGPWTPVATDSHSTWHNGGTPEFPDDGTTTEWVPTAPSKYLLVRTRTNYGDTHHTAGGSRSASSSSSLRCGRTEKPRPIEVSARGRSRVHGDCS